LGQSAVSAYKSNMDSLTGKLLIAMPSMGDPRFEQSVIVICDHSEEGAMGIIVNKPSQEVSFSDLLNDLGIAEHTDVEMPIHFGGPVELGRGFVLHSDDYDGKISSLEIPAGFALTATLDILRDIANKDGPSKAILALGYSGWGPGQLEDEIKRNGWLTSDASLDLVFGADDNGKWSDAIKALGIDVLSLSSTAGHA